MVKFNIVKVITQDPKKKEKTTKLADVPIGDVVRFLSATYKEATSGDKNGHSFYMVVENQPKKTGRVSLVSLDGSSVIERDDDHQVVVHKTQIFVEQAEFVKG